MEVSAAGAILEDEREANIAWFLMQFGDWAANDPQMRFKDGVPRAIEISVSPPPENLELVEQQGFTGIGMLSSLYSSLYNEMTLTPDGEVRSFDTSPIRASSRRSFRTTIGIARTGRCRSGDCISSRQRARSQRDRSGGAAPTLIGAA